jgi:hypothetical protein
MLTEPFVEAGLVPHEFHECEDAGRVPRVRRSGASTVITSGVRRDGVAKTAIGTLSLTSRPMSSAERVLLVVTSPTVLDEKWSFRLA